MCPADAAKSPEIEPVSMSRAGHRILVFEDLGQSRSRALLSGATDCYDSDCRYLTLANRPGYALRKPPSQS